jgi:hypothetical protein
MPYNAFLPKPGRLGIAPVSFNSGRINTGTLAAGTAVHNIGAFPNNAWVDSAIVCADTFPTAGTSCTITVSKTDGTTVTVLTTATSINTKSAGVPIALPIVTSLTDAQRTLKPTESLTVTIITAGSVTVQPDDVTVNVQLSVEN